MNNNFATKIDSEKALVYDLRLNLKGEDCYFIIKVKPELNSNFLSVVEKDNGYKLSDYGQILYHGLGEPSDELKDHLREKYSMYA